MQSVEHGLDFKLSQCFGDCSPAEEVTEADILSAVQFDSTGEYLATGDRGGRVVVFKQNAPVKQKVSSSGRTRRTSDFKFFTEFQSHEAEFDYLKSLEIEEKINQVKWCRRAGRALLLLSTNDKTIKLWRVREVPNRRVTDPGGASEGGLRGAAVAAGAALWGRAPPPKRLTLPRTDQQGNKVCAQPRRVFANAHAYHINSVDPSADGEHFLSADDLRINLWSMEVTNRAFTVVDIKPKNMEELKEVITSAAFHPHQANTFLYSTSRSSIKVADLRQAATCDRSVRVLEEPADPANKSFFSEIVASISDIKLSQCGRMVVARDYMTLKLWDVRMEARPVKAISVHEHLRPRLLDLYENDCIFDKFECAISGTASNVVTGSYNNMCSLYSCHGQGHASLEITKDPSRRSSAKKSKRHPVPAGANGSSAAAAGGPQPGTPAASAIDFDRKILHMSWHPRDDIIAVAGLNKLYIYTAQKP
ncbi:protein phosphatase PP2A regulatory subunit B [Tribonema minus]|uniref:Serine/threonine-protein phosphatase 2A 55 kDa regulatory subunit B n=1 Tax=Tribonema minus TaxID=303371 RepID=A0A836CB72_9STRA|nr:protein phosphatase PP2A regulatory subunit B [Tribonema minus]